MKQKIILKIMMLVALFIAFIAIMNVNNSYADVPEGSLKININFTNGQKSTGTSYIQDIVCEVKSSSGSIPEYDSDFATRNGVTIEQGGIIRIPESKIVNKGTAGNYAITLTGMPNGEYTINNVSATMQSSWINYYQVRYLSGDSTFNVNNNEAQIEANMLETYCNKYYYYYVDHSGKNPSVTFQLGSLVSGFYKFNYSKDDDGNNIYTYDLNGETTDIIVKSRERTIVKDLPSVSNWPFRFMSNITYGGRILSYSKGVTASNGTTQYMFVSNIDSDGPGIVKAHYLEYFDIQKVAKINKKDNMGKIANAKFKIYDTNFNKYRGSDYYETYEYNGETYSNVYVLNDSLSDEGEEISTKEGEATIIYPNVTFVADETYHTGYFKNSSFRVLESNADEGLFYNPTESAFIGGFDGNDISTPTLSLYDGGSLTTALDENPVEFDYDKITTNWNGIIGTPSTINVTNYIKPSVEKVVLNPDGTVNTTCEDEFEFALYDRNFDLVDIVKVKANEKKYFDVESYFRTGKITYYPFSRYEYYIAEIKREDYTFEDVTSTPMPDESSIGELYTFTQENLDKIQENVYETCYKYTAKSDNYAEVKFTDKMVGTEINGVKNWDDKNNEAGKRPNKIKVILKLNDEVIKTLIVEPDNEGIWKYVFENVPKYKNGEEAEYSIDEEEVDMYEIVINGFDITNIFHSKKVTVTKVWDDNENKDNTRPTFLKMQLYANGEAVGEPIILNNENDWTYTWNHLHEKMNNIEVKYTVEEVEVPENYKVEVSGSEEEGFVVKNTYVEPEEEPIEEEPAEEPEEEPTEEPEEEPTEEPAEEPEEEPAEQEKTNPQTGDEILSYILILIIAGAVFIGIGKCERKKNK